MGALDGDPPHKNRGRVGREEDTGRLGIDVLVPPGAADPG
jgi:hypothetical protein